MTDGTNKAMTGSLIIGFVSAKTIDHQNNAYEVDKGDFGHWREAVKGSVKMAHMSDWHENVLAIY